MRLPTLRQLRHFLALAEHRHFGRAAETLGITQSTLSASIAELEAVLDATLVDRTRRRVALTPAGLEAATRAGRILRETEELAAVLQGGGVPLSGPLRLGVIPTIAPFLLPPALPALRRRYPELRLFLREDLTARLVEDLEAGRLDVLLLALPCDCGPAVTWPLFDDPFAFACLPEHPLAAGERVEAAGLAETPLLLLEDGHCLRAHALDACGIAAARATGFEGTSLGTLVQMVDNGLGVTLLPQLALEAGVLAGTRIVTRPLAGERPARTVGLAWRQGSKRAEEFALLGRELKVLSRRR